MYPRNAASPERIAIGAVVQISDGAVQTSGVSVKVMPQGGAASAGGGTVGYEEGIVHYIPTQAETNHASFVVIAYKTGCIPVAQTIVTSKSATTGYAGLDWGQVTGASTTVDLSGTTIATTQKVDVNTIKTQAVTCGAGVTVLASVGTAATSTAQTGDAYAVVNSGTHGNAALKALIDAIDDYVDTEVAAIKAKTDALPADPADASDLAALFTALQSHGDATWSTATGFSTLDAAGVRAALGLASANLDTQLAALPTADENADALIGRNIEGGSSTGRTVAQALAFLRNKWEVSGATLTVYGVDDSTPSWAASVTQTAGNPISAVDPT